MQTHATHSQSICHMGYALVGLGANDIAILLESLTGTGSRDECGVLARRLRAIKRTHQVQ